MGSLATYKTTYLATPPVPTGDRMQLAGLIYTIERKVAEGMTVAQAVANIPKIRSSIVIHEAQRVSNPFQDHLAADFVALDAP